MFMASIWCSRLPVKWMLALYLLLSVHLIAVMSRISFTATGAWKQVAPDQQINICEDQHMCTKHNFTWVADYPSKTYLVGDACSMLARKGITSIQFRGDSYSRHMYQAMLILLRNDYERGAMSPEKPVPDECKGSAQFYHKDCADIEPQRVCGGGLALRFVPHAFGMEVEDCAREKGHVYFWSVGNHALPKVPTNPGPYGRDSINDWRVHQAWFNNTVCIDLLWYQRDRRNSADERMRDNQISRNVPPTHTKAIPVGNTDEIDFTKSCSVWWVPTHYRYRAFFKEEVPERVHEYNVRMREFFDSNKCGLVNYVDVYNMTASLVLNHDEAAAALTYDKVHWSMEVNLVKVQILLNALASSNTK